MQAQSARDLVYTDLARWHADVKPDNILRIHEEFKLADFGFAKFKRRTEEIPREFIDGGTENYGQLLFPSHLIQCLTCNRGSRMRFCTTGFGRA